MIEIVNGLINALGIVLTAMLSLLPSSPFNFVQNIDADWLKAINWIFPIAEAIAMLELFLTATVSYYSIRIVLKWLKAAGA